ncbi:hypothetical protein WIW49_04820 [Xanthomonas euroxanthea]
MRIADALTVHDWMVTPDRGYPETINTPAAPGLSMDPRPSTQAMPSTAMHLHLPAKERAMLGDRTRFHFR